MQLKKLKSIVASSGIIVLTISFFLNATIYAEESDDESSEEVTTQEETIDIEERVESTSQKEPSYSSYIKDTESDHFDGEAIHFEDMTELQSDSVETFEGKDVISIGQDESGSLTLDVPETAYYQIGFDYRITGNNVLPTQLEMRVDNEFHFYEMRNLVFESSWENPSEFQIDKYGNEIIPQPIKVDEWQSKYLIDSSYRDSTPLMVKLNEGENDINFTVTEGNISIKSIELTSKSILPVHEIVDVTGDGYIEVEAASELVKRNDSSIRANASTNVNLIPYSDDKRVLNHIDGGAFNSPGHKIYYDIEVEEEGFYHLGVHYQQTARSDFPVFMNIEIDEKIPYEILKDYPFPYESKYNHFTLIDQDESSIPIYLEEGTHSVSFQITTEPIKEALETVERLTEEIQNLSLEITNLVGPEVDRNRDINVEEYIPGTTELLLSWADEMGAIYNKMTTFNDEKDTIGAFSGLRVAEEQLRSLAQEPERLARRKNELSTGGNSVTSYLGNLLQDLNNNGISIDRFYFYQDEKDVPESAGIVKSAWAGLKRFINTFGEQDYDISSVDDEKLQVWINRPRQYIEIIQQLIDETFTAETGIEVDISLMPDPNKLILANAAGDAPDVAMGINYAMPFEIGIRGALQDLTEFDDYNEVVSDYAPGMLVPGTIQDGVYAIPDTMSFWVMFYRKDILDDMGLEIPDTIADVRSYLPELQRRGMNFFYPTAGMPGMKIFAGTMPLIYQSGGQLYGDTIYRTELNENESIEGMELLTELFTIYNVPYDVPSFYQQFRDGSIPIGISDYHMYNLILNAAPEIANVWDVALIPGIENEEGEVERWATGGSESNIMFENTDKKEESWEFMKWWSSAETQVAFGNTLQTTYGPEYMWNTANLNAFPELPWANSHKATILEQAEWIAEVPRAPGSYLLERELSNAYNSVVLDGENLRTAIDLASKRVNREIERKLEEFGFMRDGEIIEHYPNPELRLREE